MSGKRAVAPCGHEGQHIVGQFVACDRGCDGMMQSRCPRCGSSDIAAFEAPALPPGLKHCLPCGKVWGGGV